MINKMNEGIQTLKSTCVQLFSALFITSFSLMFFLLTFFSLTFFSLNSYAQDINNIRWQSEQHVRSLYGEPDNITGPIGTHATYTLWKYADFTVAFANQRAFHVFDKGSLTQVKLEENR